MKYILYTFCTLGAYLPRVGTVRPPDPGTLKNPDYFLQKCVSTSMLSDWGQTEKDFVYEDMAIIVD